MTIDKTKLKVDLVARGVLPEVADNYVDTLKLEEEPSGLIRIDGSEVRHFVQRVPAAKMITGMKHEVANSNEVSAKAQDIITRQTRAEYGENYSAVTRHHRAGLYEKAVKQHRELKNKRVSLAVQAEMERKPNKGIKVVSSSKHFEPERFEE